MTAEFELYYKTEFKAYGAIIRRPGKDPETYHSSEFSVLRKQLSMYGFWPSTQIPKLALEMGAIIIVRIPNAEEIKDVSTLPHNPDF